jgi:hypothetical protein
VPIVNSHMRMQVDAFGKIEPSLDYRVTEVKMDRDLSSVVYDHFSTNPQRNRYNPRGNQNRGQQSVNDTESVNTFLSSQIGGSNLGGK